jgi:ferritin-like metal-binding protein YciE
MSKSSKSSKENQKNLEKKLGEVLGLERANQKAVEEMISMKLLKSDTKDKAKEIQDEANSHEEKLQKVISQLSEDGDIKLNQDTIKDIAKETEKKATKMMKTYLGDEPDTSEALEFLCLAEGGEVTHYEVLSSISKNFEIKELSSTVNSILKEEQDHLQSCLNLAKENVS